MHCRFEMIIISSKYNILKDFVNTKDCWTLTCFLLFADDQCVDQRRVQEKSWRLWLWCYWHSGWIWLGRGADAGKLWSREQKKLKSTAFWGTIEMWLFLTRDVDDNRLAFLFQALVESINLFVTGDHPVALKNVALRVMLTLVTVSPFYVHKNDSNFQRISSVSQLCGSPFRPLTMSVKTPFWSISWSTVCSSPSSR